MTYVPRFAYNLYTERFRQLTPGKYEEVRGHPGAPVKQRADDVSEEALQQTGDNVRELAGGRGREASMRQFILNGRNTTKPAGFNGPREPIATRGTSQPDTLCFSDWFESCVGLAIGGENIGKDGRALPGAKARIWHISGFETDAQKAQLRAYIEKLRSHDLTIRAGMFGGRAGFSEDMVHAVEEFLAREFHISLEFNETCAQRTGDDFTPFGIAIQRNHKLQFVDDLRKLAYQDVDIAFSDFGDDDDESEEESDSDDDRGSLG
ncbi:MAG: hypothetical protein GAK35_04209 [Herbaspirillum frisingense]|uniref:Uncharacterized protein n=1 Tax=Herbaspirillum frisingense TaxID=92645 RepID=A0A7V8JSH7_9BURK|nr:MAG: hypothetical protein GAK35_04209 [Herbaspirillum frisingense]